MVPVLKRCLEAMEQTNSNIEKYNVNKCYTRGMTEYSEAKSGIF